MSIRINATVNEARAAAGHNREQWDRFYFITKDEAKRLAEAHEEWTRWILIPANEKEQMLERINCRLQAEGIPPVEMIILKWRVSQLLRDIQRKYSTCHGPHLHIRIVAYQHTRRQYDERNARLAVRVGDAGADTVGGQQHAAIVKPPALGIFAKRDPPVRPDPGCVTVQQHSAFARSRPLDPASFRNEMANVRFSWRLRQIP
ncbi:hypothetical protein ST47_g9987 [Ascochyta rabiei]|uniref:Uncharacterized protein n=1 Tax=Didymella rabiei TaxID=5454 RepID=A0A162VYI5_DIDRA|nr:hypothetical protein ST47_g9987 [Ascochyta rabiei]